MLLFDAVSDGKHVIFAMLIVGLIFCSVIAVGQLVEHLAERRRERKRSLRPY